MNGRAPGAPYDSSHGIDATMRRGPPMSRPVGRSSARSSGCFTAKGVRPEPGAARACGKRDSPGHHDQRRDVSRFGRALTRRTGAAFAGAAILAGGLGLGVLAPAANAGVTTPTVHCVL